MEKKIEFRNEENSDIERIRFVVEKAFSRDDETLLVEKLRKNLEFNKKLSFVALIDSTIVAHLLFTPIDIVFENGSKIKSSLALAPISVLPEYQRQQIGSRLIEFALSQIKSLGVYSSIIVLGHEHFYPRFGFKPARFYRIRPPFQVQNENCFMALEIEPNVLSENQFDATVKYLPEFGL